MDPILLEKLQHFCEYAERCEHDVVQKCYRLKIPRLEHAAYIAALRRNNFLNEARFIQHFVYSRSTYKKWGAAKIKAALAAKGIRGPAVQPYLDELEPEATQEQANAVAAKKWPGIKGELRERKLKLLRFLIGRGYDMGTAKKAVEQALRD
ncbi:MAG: RecX family transcriptional regulator [Chitinophagales bacterium]